MDLGGSEGWGGGGDGDVRWIEPEQVGHASSSFCSPFLFFFPFFCLFSSLVLLVEMDSFLRDRPALSHPRLKCDKRRERNDLYSLQTTEAT
jgi:hypothetical protein